MSCVLAIFGVAARQVVAGLVLPFVQVDALILESVGKLVRQHRLLRIGRDPIEQIHGFCLAVVVRGNLLVEQLDEERLQMEILVDEAELLEDNFGPLHAFGVLVVHFPKEILFDFGTRGQVGLHLVLDGQLGIF
jgi:hypothetical protein